MAIFLPCETIVAISQIFFTEELVPVQIKMATSSPIQKNCHLSWCHTVVLNDSSFPIYHSSAS